MDGDILRWQEPYWERVTDYLRLAADNGITVMLYPIDGWTIGHSFVPMSIQQCRTYGAKVAERFRDLPNIVWMAGGDYWYAADAKDPTHGRPFSIQFNPQSISTDETLRRQVLWSLTSGAAREFYGSDDWEFHDGWQRRLSTRALADACAPCSPPLPGGGWSPTPGTGW